jgi:hypothetical protein
LFRVGRTVMGPLLEAWNRALRLNLDSYSGCRTCTLLARSTEIFDSSTDLSNGPESRTASTVQDMLSNLKIIVDLAKYLGQAFRGSSFEWCGALNISEMTKSAVCDLDIHFQDVLTRLVYFMAETCIVAWLSRWVKYAVGNAAAAVNIFERPSSRLDG